MKHYGKRFYQEQQSGSYLSAQEIFPFVLKNLKVASVIDIGCGVAPWLKVLSAEHGVKEILGVDGDYVDKQALMIEADRFISYDLKQYFKAPKKFDLAVSVEVGEHLPDECADNLVRSLTDAADFVLFSAALPGQGGTYHINEQFPEYWAKKFFQRGFTVIDIRKVFWSNEKIEWWYRQNLVLYVKTERISSIGPELGAMAKVTDPEFLTRVHPEKLSFMNQRVATLVTPIGFIKNKLRPLKKMLKK